MAKRTRNIHLHFMVDEKEREVITQKMSMVGTDNIGAYLRRMAIYGYMLEVDMNPLNGMAILN